MCQEVFEIVKSMDKRNIELQLCLQCSPLIAGLKVSNLFIINKHDEETARDILDQTHLSYYRLAYDNDRVIFLVYDRGLLTGYLSASANYDFLKSMGYESNDLEYVLNLFKKRYCQYLNTRNDFPHEIGIVLGYPLNDVIGFMKYGGQKYQVSGYWKVYENAEITAALFKNFDTAKDDMILRLFEGKKIYDIVSSYKNNSKIA